jgi:hypothetical protein
MEGGGLEAISPFLKPSVIEKGLEAISLFLKPCTIERGTRSYKPALESL